MKQLFFALVALRLSSNSTFAINDLANTTRSLVSYNTTAASGSLSFDDTMIYSRFCNTVRQGYTLSGTSLYSTGPTMSTMMYCDGMSMTLEQNFLISSTGATTLVMSGEQLSITSYGNIFVFVKKLLQLSDLNSQCIQAYDSCNNMCTREAGKTDRACTKKACIGDPKDAQCIMSTNDIDLNESVCTMEYAPVCGSLQVQCVKAPCPPVQESYSNRCMMNNAGAQFLYEGECTNTNVGNDKDTHGCIGSAGYSWSQSKQECIKIWEYTATDLEKAYDFAFNHGITTMDSLKKFRANDSITRQEAAKMFVAMAEKVYNKKYASFPNECNVAYSDEKIFDTSLKNYIYDACAHGIMKGSKKNFSPRGHLTRGQALAIIMRTIDGWQDSEKTSQPRWMPYADKVHELGYLSFANFKGFEDPITRGELIEWINIVSNKGSVVNLQNDQIIMRGDVLSILTGGNVASVAQSHNLQVRISLKDGINTYTTTEPSIDAIFNLIKECGNTCKDIAIATE